MRRPSPFSGVEMKYWDCCSGFCSFPIFPWHSLTLTLVCQSKWWTANTGRTKTRSAEPVCFSLFGEGGWVTPRHLETHYSTEVMSCSLFSGKMTWCKHRLTRRVHGLEPLRPYLLPDSNKTSVLSFTVVFFLIQPGMLEFCSIFLVCLVYSTLLFDSSL